LIAAELAEVAASLELSISNVSLAAAALAMPWAVSGPACAVMFAATSLSIATFMSAGAFVAESSLRLHALIASTLPETKINSLLVIVTLLAALERAASTSTGDVRSCIGRRDGAYGARFR
jgi:hypothetical protein